MNKKLQRRKESMAFVVGITVGIIIGVIMGMLLQQMIFKISMIEFGESLEGTTINIEIDLNETELLEGFKKIFNQTIIQEQKK